MEESYIQLCVNTRDAELEFGLKGIHMTSPMQKQLECCIDSSKEVKILIFLLQKNENWYLIHER